MKRINKLTFLIHGFCYAGMYPDRTARQGVDRLQPYFAREEACAEKWFSLLNGFSDDEALAIIPWGSEGAAADYHAAAGCELGDRCFLLDAPGCYDPQFWASGDARYNESLLREVRSAILHQGSEWNKEEMDTALHCRACCRQLDAMLEERGYKYDRATVAAEGWGASFDGCVTKYTLNLRRMLGLANVVEIDFGMTVPDARFLLDASCCECLPLGNGLRLFLFMIGGSTVGLYSLTTSSLADHPAYVKLKGAPDAITVKSKQGIRLWPQPEMYSLSAVPPGYEEPPQVVVKHEGGALYVPASAGVVYRLAKAPAYVFMPNEMPYTEARAFLASAEMV